MKPDAAEPDSWGAALTPRGLHPARPVWLALLGGALQALAFAAAPASAAANGNAPFAQWVGWHIDALPWLPGLLQILGQALLAWVLLGAPAAAGDSASPRAGRRAALAGWLYALAWLSCSVWWLFISMHRYGGLPAWLAALAVLGLSAALALYWAAAAWACARWRSGHPLADALLFAALCLLAELARGQWLTGFPWAAAGYAHVDGPLADWAPWLGVYGIGAVAAFMAASLAQLAMAHRPRRQHVACGAVALACVVAPSLLPREFTQSAGTLSVTLLQGNVPQNEKFDPALLPATMDWHLSALGRARTDLVLAAETALPLLPSQMPDGLWEGLAHRFAEGRTAALLGVPLGNYEEGYTNSAIGLVPGQPAYRYDKHHLVPFGEFIPLGFRWFVEMMNIPLGDFNRGPLVAPSLRVGSQRVAPNICYEDVFGEELAARFVVAEQAPTILANLSNIGWFGNTVAVAQHLQMSRLRALELQRPMLRATNTGATAVIDHQGAVTAALPPYIQGVLQAQVEGRTGLTPFARWAGHWGLWPLWLGGLLIAAYSGLRISARISARI